MTPTCRSAQYRGMAGAVRLAMPVAQVRSEAETCAHFEKVFQTYFHFVCVTLLRLGVRERDVEDVAQDLFVAVHRKLDAYDTSRPIQLWLYGFCLRAASTYRRLARNHRLVHMDTDVEAPDPDASADDKIAAGQNRRFLFAALDELDDGRREVFVMHDLDEIPAAQIAEMLTIPLNTVYSRVRHAREDLRKIMTRMRAARGSR
ncbi:MAG: polymerase sigma factor RpoE [Labilithrix sp.]|nr:polymerase sigma factor RpoE [Labilithrix sp.]